MQAILFEQFDALWPLKHTFRSSYTMLCNKFNLFVNITYSFNSNNYIFQIIDNDELFCIIYKISINKTGLFSWTIINKKQQILFCWRAEEILV